MGPLDAIKTCLAKSFQFKGRASRSEFWWFTLTLAIAFAAPSSRVHAEENLSSTLRTCHDFELEPARWSGKIEQLDWRTLSEEEAERWFPAYVVSSLSISWPDAGQLRLGLFENGMDRERSLSDNPRVDVNWWVHPNYDGVVLRTSISEPPETSDDDRLVASCFFVSSSAQTIDQLVGFLGNSAETLHMLETDDSDGPNVPVLFTHIEPEYLAIIRDAAYSPTSALKTLNAKFLNEVLQ